MYSMRQIPTHAMALLCLLVLLTLRSPATAQHGSWCACGEFESTPVTFEIDHAVAWRWAAVRAFDRWNTYGNLLQWRQGDGSAGINGKNEVIFFTPEQSLDIYGIVLDQDTFGVTYINPPSAFGAPSFDACPPPPNTACGIFTEADIIINSTFDNGWQTSGPNYNDTGPANYGATMLHEVGHTLGLHHNFTSLSVMNHYEDFASIYLSHSDARAVRGHYPGIAITSVDIATYPFRFEGFQYDGTTVASVAPATVQAGGVFSLGHITVENIGTEPLQNVELQIYLSINDNITTSDYLAGRLRWSVFSTWWDTTDRQFRVPTSVPPGTYYVGAIITYNNGATDAVVYNNRWVLDAANRLTVVGAVE